MLGRVSVALTAILGLFVLTLPVPIVVNSFAGYYRNRLLRKVVAMKRNKRLRERRKALRYQTIETIMRDGERSIC